MTTANSRSASPGGFSGLRRERFLDEKLLIRHNIFQVLDEAGGPVNLQRNLIRMRNDWRRHDARHDGAQLTHVPDQARMQKCAVTQESRSVGTANTGDLNGNLLLAR